MLQKASTNKCPATYIKISLREIQLNIINHNFKGRLKIEYGLRYTKRKYRHFRQRFGTVGRRKANKQSRLWFSKPVTWMWSHQRKGYVYPFIVKSVRIYVPAFWLPKSRLLLNDRLNEIWLCEDFFLWKSIATLRCDSGVGTAFR